MTILYKTSETKIAMKEQIVKTHFPLVFDDSVFSIYTWY